jgi:CHAT domain-containing protein
VARNNGDVERQFKLAAESARVSSTPIARARNHLELVLYYRQIDDIRTAIAECRAGLAVDLGDPRHHAHTDGKMYLALALTDLENPTPQERAEAESVIAEALEISIAVRDQFREIQAQRIQAVVKLKLGKTREALAGFNRTLELSQVYRARSSSSEVRASMLKDEQIAFRGLFDIVLADVARRPAGELRPASAAELAAFLQLERARQRSFGALRVGALDASTAAQVDDLLQQMGQKSLRIAALLDTKDPVQATELQSLQLDMSRLHAELDSLRSSAAMKHAQVAMSSTSPNQTWRPLAPGSVHLSYAFGDKYVFALVRSSSGTFVTRLGPGRKDLELQLAELSKLDVRTAAPRIEAALERASAALLPAGLLPADSTTVDIVSEGRISSVPFPALRSPTDPKQLLVETHDVAMVTTLLGVDEAPRRPGSRPFRFVALASGSGTYRAAAVADPTPKLNAARKEIGAAAALFKARDPAAKVKLFTGPDGNAAALRDIWASGSDVVHFATHALADLRQPIASLLVLPATDANGKATYLTAGQVQAWRGDTELVFLSACESAIGPPQYAAGMPGLQRAFLRAGARGVIATLAPIEDVLAQQFSEDFYSRYTKGVPAARALSETQRAWLAPKPGMSEEEQLRRRIMALVHAYYAG